ncbi:MAG: hypothetical protein COX80_05440 [Candidatus Magasanikbacteria bacterium CG_4_10_14_0_2_um_filter_33_14]|uniref:LytR/CpsA/Psr regulator C-terminal domain-containing protein n=1 Tax=Candidatus Magasanikbacteria bacterium CG_4_10_14_0_2_um_filter_33_14 TaxID=1974636 RepID=A0A2M7V843_9BACT|nr:MAG: hypothetical protein COX80_05440 [Candidatus Magasanikbacteria bacterium CG_4_10_14_0_2_um_filter_33_14]
MEDLQNNTSTPNRHVESVRVHKVRKSNGKNFVIFLLIIFMLAGMFGSYYFYNKYSQLKKDPDITSQKELDTTLKSVGKLMLLPSDEAPTMATVLDKSKLQDQAFFSGVEDNDKLLIFPKASQAIIYRPSTNKIIKVGPIFINDEIQNDLGKNAVNINEDIVNQEEIVVTSSLRIAYYNGTDVANLSAQTESFVKLKYPDYKTTILSNASKQDYKQNIVVDISEQYPIEVSGLASLLGAKVETLPEGEIKPDADILIILGK